MFAPSLSDSTAKTTRAPYSGHEQSLQAMAARIREGSVSPRIRAWAGKAILAAGVDGRSGIDQTRQRVSAILGAFRVQTVYTPDPVNKELIQSAEVTLCLDPGLCIPMEDCDGSVVAVASATSSVGIPTMVVKEDYPSGEQSHVLLACRDEKGEWFFVDPSTNKPVGVSYAPAGTKRTWINPMEGAPVEIIGIGSAPQGGALVKAEPLGRPFEELSEVIAVGLGADPPPPTPPGPFAVQIPGNWIPAVNNALTAGLRYGIGIVTPDSWTDQDVRAWFGPDGTFGPSVLVESIQLVPGVYTTFNPWIVIGIARADAVVQSHDVVTVSAVLQESPAPAAQQGPTQPGGAPPKPPIPPAGISLGEALAIAAGLAAVGGIAYGAYEYKKKHGRHLHRALLKNPVSRKRLKGRSR